MLSADNAKYDDIRVLVEAALQMTCLCYRSVDERWSIRSVRALGHPPSAMSGASRSPLAQVYNEMHGLFVQVGKHYCAKQTAKVR